MNSECISNMACSVCCGEACKVEVGSPPTKPPAKRAVVPQATARDVTAIKRTWPLERANNKRDCTFSGSGKALTTFAAPVKAGGSDVTCPGNSECTNEVKVSYTASSTNAFGVSAEVGDSLFEVVSISVSFSYEHSEAVGTGYEHTYSTSRPAGSSGYITFAQRLECEFPPE